MFGYQGIRLSKRLFWHFDNRMFGYRGTTVPPLRTTLHIDMSMTIEIFYFVTFATCFDAIVYLMMCSRPFSQLAKPLTAVRTLILLPNKFYKVVGLVNLG